jgi:hypothetical protein
MCVSAVLVWLHSLMAAYAATPMQVLWPHNHSAEKKFENLMATESLEFACFPYALGVTSQICTAAESKVYRKRRAVVQH